MKIFGFLSQAPCSLMLQRKLSRSPWSRLREFAAGHTRLRRAVEGEHPVVCPRKRTVLFSTGMLCLCLTFPFNVEGGQAAPAATDNAQQQKAAEDPSAVPPTVPQPKPEVDQPAVAPAATATPHPNAAGTRAGESRPTDESPIVLRATTRLVMVDVLATDSHGHPVLDLRPQDFTVLEDGKRQAVRVFGLHQPPTDELKPASIPALPPNMFTNIPLFELGSSLNVILLDSLNTPLTGQAHVRNEVLDYIGTLPRGSLTAIYALGQRLAMIQDFTADSRLLREAVEKAGPRTSALLDSASTRRQVEIYPPGFLESLPIPIQESLVNFETERSSYQTDERVWYTMDALQSIAHWLSGYQGRKNLIWISEAFPLSINPAATLTLSSTLGGGSGMPVIIPNRAEFTAKRSYENAIAKTAAMLADSQIAVYPMDARGVATAPTLEAASTGYDRLGQSTAMGDKFGTALAHESTDLWEAHSSMDRLAERTGGKAFYDRNDIANGIRDSVKDGSTYYLLGYYPEDKDWNGKFRKVEVKVDRPGLKLRHRLGYFAANPRAYGAEDSKQRAHDLAEAMSLERPASTALFFKATVEPPSPQNNNQAIVVYAVDSHPLALERSFDGVQHADLECVVEAYSEKGKPITYAGSTVHAAMSPKTFQKVQQVGFPCRTEIALAAGNYLLRLGVRDTHTGLIGTANAKINIGKDAEAKR